MKFIYVYASQVKLIEKWDYFYATLLQTRSIMIPRDFTVTGDSEWHVNQHADCLYDIYGNYEHGSRNREFVNLLKFHDATELKICNEQFRKLANLFIISN